MPILPDTNASSAETDVTHLLLVEDDPAYAELVRESLRDERAQFETQLADDLAGALQLLAERRFDAVLLDLSLPASQGLETVSRVVEAYPNVPIVVLTGLHDDALGLEAVHAGAQDYLVKGDGGGPLILRALRYAMERKHTETALRHARDELERRVEERTAGLREANERLQRESDQRREAETNLRRNHDFIAAVLETIGALVIVVVSDADEFVTAHREKLERYADDPAAESRLVIRPTKWNAQWRLNKAIEKVGAVAKTGDLTEAAALIGAIIEKSPNVAAFHDTAAQVAAKQGNLPSAIEHLEKAVELEPDSVEWRVNLAEIMVQADKLDEARQLVERMDNVDLNDRRISPAVREKLQALRDRFAEELVTPAP